MSISAHFSDNLEKTQEKQFRYIVTKLKAIESSVSKKPPTPVEDDENEVSLIINITILLIV